MTRREQYLKRRAKFILRRERARSINSVWGRDPVTGKTQRVAYQIQWQQDGPMMPQRVSSNTYNWTDFQTPGLPAGPYLITGGGPRRPPHAHVLPPAKRPNAFYSSNADYASVGFHKRGVQRWKRKPNRMNKRERAIWLANMAAWREGFFPDWDPLQRHPNPQDIANGDPFITEFPYYW